MSFLSRRRGTLVAGAPAGVAALTVLAPSAPAAAGPHSSDPTFDNNTVDDAAAGIDFR